MATGKNIGASRDNRLASFAERGLDRRLDALVKFALTLVRTSGTVPQITLDSVRQAGYSDVQVTEAIFAITAILTTNIFNRVNDTTLDFPPVK